MEIRLPELSRRVGTTVLGIGYLVERCEIIGRENDYQLIEELLWSLKAPYT